jgi:hypothetical protein
MATEAGRIDVEMKKKQKGWGLADSIVLCLAQREKRKVVTGDLHFKELEDVIFIKYSSKTTLNRAQAGTILEILTRLERDRSTCELGNREFISCNHIRES